MSRNAEKPPLAGVRVLEASVNRPGRIAGMLLADLGADVVRATDPAADTPPTDVESLAWDRGKRLFHLEPAGLAGLAAEADAVIVDHNPAPLAAAGLDAATLQGANPAAVHVWMPPYAAHGEWSEVAEDPLLLAAIGGIAGRYPSPTESPVAPTSSPVTQIQGALGAAAVLAGLVGRGRNGRGAAAVVSGLHAAAAAMTMVSQRSLDKPLFHVSRGWRSVPYWRIYEGSDGNWLFVAALGAGFFERTLEVLGRGDVMQLEGVDGEFTNMYAKEVGIAVGKALEPTFRTRPRDEWLEALTAVDVPCAAISTREEWAASDIAASNHVLSDLTHEILGHVRVAGPMIQVGEEPSVVGGFPTPAAAPPDGVWKAPQLAVEPIDPAAPTELPLHGITVADASSFLAGPLAAGILADWGADVVKVEPPRGDPFRSAPMSVLVATQHKRSLAIDLSQERGRGAFLDLLARSALLIENFRPGRLERLGLSAEELQRFRPGMVLCNVSAYGHAGEYADVPGFDPVFQCRTGLGASQGGDDDPVLTDIPIVDVAASTLALVGSLAGLYAAGDRGTTVAPRVFVSLANAATFLQSPEFVDFAGRAAPQAGSIDFRGPDACHRYYECEDGWLAVAADEGELPRLLAAIDADDPDRIAARLRPLRREEALARLGAAGVPALPVIELEKGGHDDPFLVENRFSHVVEDPRYGRIEIVRGYGDWGTNEGRRPARAVLIGHDSREVLAELGYSDEQIHELVESGVVVELRD
jgi:crotonobetainyl-CoA:carnitine CoA-transferase CaiB-like acyl-CoA transferase